MLLRWLALSRRNGTICTFSYNISGCENQMNSWATVDCIEVTDSECHLPTMMYLGTPNAVAQLL